jgi:hypothetical protein
VDWIDLAQDREKSEICNHVNEFSISGSVKCEKFLPEELLSSQEGRCYMDLLRTVQVRLH